MAPASPIPTASSATGRSTAHPVLAADAAACRLAARLSTEYFLRTAQLISENLGGELTMAVVLRAVVAAHTSYLDQDVATSVEFASLEGVPPDELRRPVSVMAIAQSLYLPFETTRRHVNKLIKIGLCKRVQGGIIAPAASMREATRHEATLANMANLRRLYRSLKRAGVTFD